MASAELNNDTLTITGDIDFNTVVALRNKGESLINNHSGDLVVDLAAVNNVNTAAMALLLSWYRTAKSGNIDLQYRNVPASLTAIAEMSDLGGLLG